MTINSFDDMKVYLDQAYQRYANSQFVDTDPVQIPHHFQQKADIEIAALFAATLAWGNRKSIITSTLRLMQAMDNQPYEFVSNFGNNDTKYLQGFVHRTFNATDAEAFVRALQRIYNQLGGLESVFTKGYKNSGNIIGAIQHFRKQFIYNDFPQRSAKHVSDIGRGSAAKRLNMFVRWMVRPNVEGIDFGIWKQIPTSALLIPLDVHTSRVARGLGLLQRKQNDLKAVVELTNELQKFDKNDPVKYDLALFAIGIEQKI